MSIDMILNPDGWIDFHTHCLSGIDDGAPTVDIGILMLQLLKKQCVQTAALTPHFHANKDDLHSFLDRREQAYADLLSSPNCIDIPSTMLGAEIALIREISTLHLRSLCVGNTNLLLLELPYTPYNKWMMEEIQNIIYSHQVIPVLAHIERYLPLYREDQYKELFSIENCVLQVSVGALLHRRAFNFIKSLIKSNCPVILGSDCHNMMERKPNFEIVQHMEQRITARKYIQYIRKCMREYGEKA